jgi:2-oxoglutarate/2-oxoacid ferredoxin oxidoreductase subunit alpha
VVNGNISHDGPNHQLMVNLRQDKLERVADFIPELEILGDATADLLVVGWGGTYGHLFTAVEELNKDGAKVALAHFNYIQPLPKNTQAVLGRFKSIVVCELNLGQFAGFLRMKFPQFSYQQFNKVQGLPFAVQELKIQFVKLLESKLL